MGKNVTKCPKNGDCDVKGVQDWKTNREGKVTAGLTLRLRGTKRIPSWILWLSSMFLKSTYAGIQLEAEQLKGTVL